MVAESRPLLEENEYSEKMSIQTIHALYGEYSFKVQRQQTSGVKNSSTFSLHSSSLSHIMSRSTNEWTEELDLLSFSFEQPIS